MDTQWLEWVQKLQAIAQNGLTYARDPFDIERYESVREIAAEIAAVHSHMDVQYILNLFAGEVGYLTPKTDVRGAVFREETILLVKERGDGFWTLPGGWVDIGESPSEAVVREVHEESGYVTRPVKLLALYDKNKHAHPPSAYHVYKLFFQCEIVQGNPSDSIETEGAAFFHKDRLPALSLPRVTPAQIARLFQHNRNPAWPTEFD